MKNKRVLTILLLFFVFSISSSAAADNPKPIIVGHRGSPYYAPENTIMSFQKAIEQGADAIEADLRLTRDNKLICIHDEDTYRVSGQKLVVKDSFFKELRKLNLGNRYKLKDADVNFPTVPEIFAAVPENKWIFFEMKDGPEAAPVFIKEVKKYSRRQFVVIAFNAETLKEIKILDPSIKTFWLTGFKEDDQSILRPTADDALKVLDEIKADGLSSYCDEDAATEAFVSSIRNKGYEYHVWVINTAAMARRFAKMGANSITTNMVRRLTNVKHKLN